MNRNLVIAIIFSVIALLCFAELCRAETTISAHIYPYGLGYDTGYGVSGENLQKIGPIGLLAYADINNQQKTGADDGYGWHYGGQARYYIDQYFIGPGYSWFGYSSEFDDGTKWAKKSGQYYAVIGGSHQEFTGLIWYQPHESDTANKVSLTRFRITYQFKKWFKFTGDLDMISFRQSGKRQSEWSNSFGMGIYF